VFAFDSRLVYLAGYSMSHLLAVMVTYRRETVALETLRTVMEQDRPPDRIWVVDNSPTDSFRSTVAE
jgi:GT2 family glycosyltransferase